VVYCCLYSTVCAFYLAHVPILAYYMSLLSRTLSWVMNWYCTYRDAGWEVVLPAWSWFFGLMSRHVIRVSSYEQSTDPPVILREISLGLFRLRGFGRCARRGETSCLICTLLNANTSVLKVRQFGVAILYYPQPHNPLRVLTGVNNIPTVR
jgi:hypothetical protein